MLATAHLASPLSAPTMPSPLGASIARSLDGRWLAVATAGEIWLEDGRTKHQAAVRLAAGDDLAVTMARLWVVRAGRLESMDIESGDIRVHELVLGGSLRLVAVAQAVIVTGDRGTWIARDNGSIQELAPHRTFVRAIADSRALIVDNGTPAIVDVAGIPNGARLQMTSRILDATPLFDRTTCLLLLARESHQELAIMRCTGSVLARIRVNHVHQIAGATRALRVALAIDDGRLMVYDLRERRVVSADRPTQRACEITLDPDGKVVTGVTHAGLRTQLFVRRFD